MLVPQLADTALIVRSRRSGGLHQCAAGSMNAQGMKEYGGVTTCDGGSSIFEAMLVSVHHCHFTVLILCAQYHACLYYNHD